MQGRPAGCFCLPAAVLEALWLSQHLGTSCTLIRPGHTHTISLNIQISLCCCSLTISTSSSSLSPLPLSPWPCASPPLPSVSSCPEGSWCTSPKERHPHDDSGWKSTSKSRSRRAGQPDSGCAEAGGRLQAGHSEEPPLLKCSLLSHCGKEHHLWVADHRRTKSLHFPCTFSLPPILFPFSLFLHPARLSGKTRATLAR